LRTGRNVIIYYSAWLQKPSIVGLQVNDADKNGFMTVIHELDRSKGLDLVLHTPGGETAATESLVDYLRSMFPVLEPLGVRRTSPPRVEGVALSLPRRGTSTS